MSQPTYNAVAYEQGRPDYPRPAIEHLIRALRIGPDDTVLDLAAGTGKLTKELVTATNSVVAVEPEPSMRSELAKHLPAVIVHNGHATSLTLPDDSVDAVAIGQAFHWFAANATLEEIARVLRPGGRLGLIWNVRDLSTPVQQALEEILSGFRQGSPTYLNSGWRDAFTPGSPFGELHEATFHQTHVVDQAGLLGLVLSMSYMSRLSQDDRTAVEKRVTAILAEHAAPGDSPMVEVIYRTEVFWAELKPSA